VTIPLSSKPIERGGLPDLAANFVVARSWDSAGICDTMCLLWSCAKDWPARALLWAGLPHVMEPHHSKGVIGSYFIPMFTLGIHSKANQYLLRSHRS
jgi:hypothetical protein